MAGQQILITLLARGIHTMLFQCGFIVFDAGPTLKQHRLNSPCLLGSNCYINLLVVPRSKNSSHGDRAFSCAVPRLWNALPDTMHRIPTE